MAEYIGKQAFNTAIREAVRKYPNTFYNGLETARQIARELPAADVAPVRHGRWIKRECGPGEFECKCSECGYRDFMIPRHDNYWFNRNFCPNCGARMDGGEENGKEDRSD